ncbi:methanogenesis marker 17 protein [archaeon]|nr:MAG: methanogenesis marker 17 protein [archaeon]
MMEVEVRGGKDDENTQIKKLAEETLKNLGLGKKLKIMLIESDIGLPAFYVACKFKKDVQPLSLGSLATLRESSKGVRISVTHERYYDQIYSTLQERVGKENVTQDERNILFVSNAPPDLDSITIYDYTEEVRDNIIDALWHILPEGFRVRRFKHREDGFIVVATDIPPMTEFTNKVDELEKEIWGEADV